MILRRIEPNYRIPFKFFCYREYKILASDGRTLQTPLQYVRQPIRIFGSIFRAIIWR